ncbi:MAG: hypothetical protein ACXVCR_07400 [Bdellovibrio sp.]
MKLEKNNSISINSIDLSVQVETSKEFFLNYNDTKNEILNMISADIKAVENMLSQANIEEDFVYFPDFDLELINMPSDSSVGLKWDKISDVRFRLLTIVEENKSGIRWKPLIEAKSHIRIKAHNWLWVFVDRFQKHLATKIKSDQILF